MPFPDRILLAADGSPSAHLARSHVVSLARSTGAEVHVVHVALVSPWTNPNPLSGTLRERIEQEARPVLDAEVAAFAQEGIEVTPHLRTGRANHEILRLRDQLDADLVVVGSRGQNAFSRVLLGDDAESIVRHAPCTVMVVRQQDGGAR